MTTLRTAAQQALEALEELNGWQSLAPPLASQAGRQAAINLRAALEQPEQEPVAWQWLNTAHFRKKLPADAEPGAWNPLYTHPPRREWRGLTDEAVIELLHSCDWRGMHLAVLVRAIEQALKEKNQ